MARLFLITLIACALCADAHANQASRRTPVVAAAESGAPSTVNIISTQQVADSGNPFVRGDPFFDEFFRRFMNPRPSTTQSLGTGVIINSEGYVLTNEHVLAGATQIRVSLADGRSFDAELVGGDPASDLAVVLVHADELLPAPKLGDPEKLRAGMDAETEKKLLEALKERKG